MSETPLYDHAFDIAFSLRSHAPDASDVTADHFRRAIGIRLARLSDDELLEAIGAPWDTYRVD